jgi:lipoprotein NlpI
MGSQAQHSIVWVDREMCLFLGIESQNEMAVFFCTASEKQWDLGDCMKAACLTMLLCVLVTSAFARSAEAQHATADLNQRAAEALAEKRYDQAIRFASEAIAADAKQPDGYALRVRAYIAAGKSPEAIADLSRLLEMSPRQPRLLETRGTEFFKLRRFKEAIADFDQECKLEPAREPWHWKRGLAYYYAGQYDKGRDQFQQYHNREDNDVENAVWRVLCMARMQDVGLKKAQADILVVRRDPRVPMMEVYALFAGKAKPEDVLRAIDRGQPDERERNSRTFYGNLYLGLYFDMTGQPKRAVEHLKIAVGHPIEHFMWNIAKLHFEMMATAKQNDQ